MNKKEKALADELLNMVNGGALRPDIAEHHKGIIELFKKWGYTWEQFKEMAIRCYRGDPYTYSTTGSEEDLQEFLSQLDEMWNS